MSNDFSVRLDDHSAELLRLMGDYARVALERIGVQAEAYAKLIVTDAARIGIDLTAHGEKDNSRVDTGNLRNRISHTYVYDQNEPCVYVGTNVSYAPYHEFGSGVFSERPGGRRGWWVYVDGQQSSGRSGGKTYPTLQEAMKAVYALRRKGLDAHATQGLYPIHFLRNAVQYHMNEYRQIIEDTYSRMSI